MGTEVLGGNPPNLQLYPDPYLNTINIKSLKEKISSNNN